MIESISIVSLPVSDQERAKRFFVEKLDWVVLRDEPMGPDARWLQIAPNAGATTSFALVTWFEHMKPGSLRGVVLNTGDLPRAHTVLRERGVAIGDIEHAPWGDFATFDDIDGNGFLLVQPTEED